MCNPHLRGKELCSLSFSVENLYKLFRILLNGRFVSSPTFIIIFNHLFISAWTHGYFILWVIIQHYFTYFIAQIVLLWSLVAFSWLSCLFVLTLFTVKFFWAFIFWKSKMLQTHLIYYMSQSYNQPSLKGICLILLENDITQDLGKRYVTHVWLFALHELQHTRLPCHSPSPRACSNSSSLSQWCHPAISSFVIPSPPAFNLSQHHSLL